MNRRSALAPGAAGVLVVLAVSHGCIDLSTERAQWFYDFSQPGDVVEVVNSVGPTLSRADGDIYDWAIPWDQRVAGSALYLRNVPDDVLSRLERLAKAERSSVSAVAIRELDQVTRRVDNADLLDALPDTGVDVVAVRRRLDEERSER